MEENEMREICYKVDIWLAVHHITFLLLPTWYTNFLFIHTNYIKLNSSTCFERNPLIIRRSTMQIVHMQPLVSSLSASDRLVQPLSKDFLSSCTRRSLAESDDTRGCICTICVDLLMMSRLRSKHVEEFNLMQFVWMNKKFVYQVGNNKKVVTRCFIQFHSSWSQKTNISCHSMSPAPNGLCWSVGHQQCRLWTSWPK